MNDIQWHCPECGEWYTIHIGNLLLILNCQFTSVCPICNAKVYVSLVIEGAKVSTRFTLSNNNNRGYNE
jgi:uncharacterized protein YbaR (Trm112 family)